MVPHMPNTPPPPPRFTQIPFEVGDLVTCDWPDALEEKNMLRRVVFILRRDQSGYTDACTIEPPVTGKRWNSDLPRPANVFASAWIRFPTAKQLMAHARTLPEGEERTKLITQAVLLRLEGK